LLQKFTFAIEWYVSEMRKLYRNEVWKKKLRGLSLQANYTDRATAACRRS
jgi:hypothetical protein